jgi:hypothetical protein
MFWIPKQSFYSKFMLECSAFTEQQMKGHFTFLQHSLTSANFLHFRIDFEN